MRSEKKTITGNNGKKHGIKKFIPYGDDGEFFAVTKNGRLFVKKGGHYDDTGEKIRKNASLRKRHP